MPVSEIVNQPGVAIASAILAAQIELTGKRLGKSATNPHFKSKYADLPSVIDAVIPVLNKHGLAVVQLPVVPPFEGYLAISTMILHAASGETLSGNFVIPLEKLNAQGVGSAFTYGCRYSLRAILNLKIDGEDDDGEGSVDQEKRAEDEKKPAGIQTPKTGAARPAPAWLKGKTTTKAPAAQTAPAPKRQKTGVFPAVDTGESEEGGEDNGQE
jgi:hypothetical protein